MLEVVKGQEYRSKAEYFARKLVRKQTGSVLEGANRSGQNETNSRAE